MAELETMGYTVERAEEVARIARSIAQTSGVSMNEAMQAICLAMRTLPPLVDAEIAMIRNNPSLNIFQKWWLIHKIKKRRKHESRSRSENKNT